MKIVFGADFSQFDSQLKAFEGKLKGVASRLESIGSKMSVAVTAPITLMGANILQVAGDFEATMNGVAAVSGAVGAEFDALRDKAKQLGAETQFSATEAAAGIEMLARNGLKATDILNGAADASLNLAASTGTDLATAANIATDVMAQFGIKAADMNKAVDRISGVTVNSKFGIQDYAYAIANGGSVAAQAGVSFDDFNATIAATAAGFDSGATAGTSFKTFLTALAPKTKEAEALQKQLGLSFFDSSGNMRSMSEISGQLQKAFIGLSDEQRTQTASTLFGNEAMITALELARTGSETFDKLSESIQKTSALDQAAKRMEGFNGAMKKLQSAIESVKIAIGDSGLLGFVTSLIEKFAAMVVNIGKLNPDLLRMGTAFAAIAAAVGPAALAMSKLPAVISPLLGVFKNLSFLLSPVALKVVAIVAAIAGLVLIGKSVFDTWKGIGTFFSDLWDVILYKFKSAIGSIVSAWEKFMSFLGVQLEPVGDIFADFGKAAGEAFTSAMEFTQMDKLWGNIKSNFGGFVDFAKETGEKMGYYLSGEFLEKYAKKGSSISLPAPKIEGQQAAAFDPFAIAKPTVPAFSIKSPVSSVSSEIIEELGAAMKNIEAQTLVFGASFDAAKAKVDALQSAMIKLAEVGDMDTFDKLKSQIEDLSAPMDGLAVAFEQMGASIVTEIGNAVAATASGAQSMGESVKRIISAFISQGIAAIISGTIMTNPTPLGLAVAGAAGTAAAALFSAAIPEFANGGIISGQTVGVMGEYFGASTNQEVVAPLDRLQELIGGSGAQEVNLTGNFVISGDDLVLALDRAQRNRQFRFGAGAR